MNPLHHQLVLASQSPRRRELLHAAGFDFEIRLAPVAEDYPNSLDPEIVPAFLAAKKARAARHLLANQEEIILAADTIVLQGQTILGKPADEPEARRMLRRLSGQSHRVITGVCLLSHSREKTFSAVSQVWFAPLSDAEIDYYIHHYAPYDKAGAYAIQEWIGWCKIERIEGSYANIVGLPVAEVYRELATWRW